MRKKAYLVFVSMEGLQNCPGITWATNKGRAMWTAVMSFCDADFGTTRQALNVIRVKRAPEYDSRCPNIKKRRLWSLDYIREESVK